MASLNSSPGDLPDAKAFAAELVHFSIDRAGSLIREDDVPKPPAGSSLDALPNSWGRPYSLDVFQLRACRGDFQYVASSLTNWDWKCVGDRSRHSKYKEIAK
jgi:hypothetical protein